MEDSLRDEKLGEALLEMYQRDKSGPFAGGITATGFSSLSFADPELTDAQLERLIQDAKSFKSSATDRQLEVEFQSLRDPNEAIFQFIPFATGLAFGERGSLTKLFGHSVPGNWITSGAIATHVFSRGNIHIISTNPDDYPAIDPKYYSHPLDAELMGRAVMHLRQLCHTEPWASMLEDGPDGEKIPMPSPALAGPFNDPKTLDEAKTFVKQNTVTCYHPIGTCSMLPRDEGGVVGPDLKVYGTRNVRVVDASIFPLHVQGNIMSLVYAVAERAADIINGVSGQPKL